jgi:lipoprotein NlpI
MSRPARFIGSFILLAAAAAVAAETADERAARLAAAIDRSTRAIAASPDANDLYLRRAGLYSIAGRHDLALADCNHVLGSDPLSAAAYDQRGSENFMLGNIEEAIQDFDRAIHLRPAIEPGHWKRGIAYYYADRYADGQRQFEGYQTVDKSDVENAVWRFLCMARSQGVDAARADLLKIDRDSRVPMMTLYELFAGRAKPADVLEAARAGSPSADELNARLFYAHLYLGLYAEVTGDRTGTREHLAVAVRDHKIDHYMWNVADVHLKQLQKPAASE